MNDLMTQKKTEISFPKDISPHQKFIITIGIKDFELTRDEYAQIFYLITKNIRGVFVIDRTGEIIDLKNFICAKKKESKEPKVWGEDIKL
jgi:hypothetical protein